jgi:threonine dehydrogenase-like Zn-dependent dehydrogenase
VIVEESPIPLARPNQVIVKTEMSAISAGTELLIYRGNIPTDIQLDTTISSLSHQLNFPTKYGYSCVGTIYSIGENVDPNFLHRRVFAFNPHEAYFALELESLVLIPEMISNENALFYPNMETAVNFIFDCEPKLGEVGIVIGQGIVGLLATELLNQFPLDAMFTLDNISIRRKQSLISGAKKTFDPKNINQVNKLKTLLQRENSSGADFILEASGNPEALNLAIELTGFASRIIIGSWYGTKQAPLNLGGDFHRNRIQIVSSQVSSISPALTGRWHKSRRFEQVWTAIQEINPAKLISHRFSLADAAKAYQLLDKNPEQALQVVFKYK